MLDQLGTVHGELTATAKQLSSPLRETTMSVQQLLETQHSLERQVTAYKEQVLDLDAAALAKRKSMIIRETYTDRSMQELQKIARTVIQLREQVIIILVSETDDKLQFVAARTSTLTPDMRTAANIALPAIEGKGGGSAAIVQGGGAHTMSATELAELLERSIPVHA